MDVAWQDSVGSFLDSSGTDPSSFSSFASDDGAALWSSSSDGPLFSTQPVLWESGADTPGDSRNGWLTLDSAGGTDSDMLSLAGWNTDATAGLAGGTLNGGLLWTAAGSNTWTSLASSDGVGLGALDLGAASGASQWQQFVDSFGSQFSTWAADVPHLLWTGAGSQPAVTVPVADGLQSLPIAANDSLSLPTLGSISPTQSVWTQQSTVWTQPATVTTLTAGPSLAATAPTTSPTTWLSGTGAVGSQWINPIAGAGSHS